MSHGEALLQRCVLNSTKKVGVLTFSDIYSSQIYYSTHFNTAQIWSWCTEYSSSVVNRYPAICRISDVGVKKIVYNFSTIKLSFNSFYQCNE